MVCWLLTNLPKPNHTTPITSPFHPRLAERAVSTNCTSTQSCCRDSAGVEGHHAAHCIVQEGFNKAWLVIPSTCPILLASLREGMSNECQDAAIS